jgi:hypothetical protein
MELDLNVQIEYEYINIFIIFLEKNLFLDFNIS